MHTAVELKSSCIRPWQDQCIYLPGMLWQWPTAAEWTWDRSKDNCIFCKWSQSQAFSLSPKPDPRTKPNVANWDVEWESTNVTIEGTRGRESQQRCRGIGVHWTFGFVQRPRFSATAPEYGSEAVGQWAGARGLSVTTKTATTTNTTTTKCYYQNCHSADESVKNE